MTLVYIGNDYYIKSGTFMGVVYTEDFKERHDWGSIQDALDSGQIVVIRPALRWQLNHADAMLGEYVRRRQ